VPRTTRAVPPRPAPLRARLTGGNGDSPPEPETNRLARMERLVEALEKQLHVQFTRITELQAQLDRAIADRPLPPR